MLCDMIQKFCICIGALYFSTVLYITDNLGNLHQLRYVHSATILLFLLPTYRNA